MRRRVALLLGLAVLGGCGGGEEEREARSDEDEIRAIVEERRSDQASICDRMTAELLDSLGGREDCRQLAQADDNRDPDAEVESVEVAGDRATVRLTGGQEGGEIVFRRVDGEWLLDRRD